MSEIRGGLEKCFDTVREHLLHYGSDDAEGALDRIEEALERKTRMVHDMRGLVQRLSRMLESHISWLRRGENWSESAMVRLKVRGDELETQLLTEFGNHSLEKMPAKALVELGVAVAAEMERRGVAVFPVTLGGDGKIRRGLDDG